MRRVAWAAAVFVTLALPSVARADLPGVSGGHVAMGVGAPARIWYFAEGFTGEGFQEYLTLGNPGTATAGVLVQYLYPDGNGLTRTVTVGPTSRVTIDVNEAVGAGREVSVFLESNEPIVAERPMYFRASVGAAGPVDGGHDIMGARLLDTTFYFAEGFTGRGFQEYLTIENVLPRTIRVVLKFLFPDGSVQEHVRDVGPVSRATVDVNSVVGADREVAILATSDAEALIERPLYFARSRLGNAGYVQGGHTVVGARSTSTAWYFAEGFTGTGFQEYVTVLNPNPQQAIVTATFQLRDGTMKAATLELPPTSRGTIDANAVVTPGAEASLVLSSNRALVAERPIYFRFACERECRFRGGHSAAGAITPVTRWLFAEGYTGTALGREFREYLTILNPNPTAVTVPITFLLASGGTDSATIEVGAMSRATVDVRAEVGDNQEVSADVGPASGAVVVERPMYFLTGAPNPLPRGSRFRDPGQASLYLYDAWKAGARAAALEAATQEAVDDVFSGRLGAVPDHESSTARPSRGRSSPTTARGSRPRRPTGSLSKQTPPPATGSWPPPSRTEELRANTTWLSGSRVRRMRKVLARVAGVEVELDAAEIVNLARSLDPEPISTYYVVIGGRRFPPKQLVAAATGLDRGDFISTQARSLLKRLGFAVRRRGSASATPPEESQLDRNSNNADALRPFRGRFVAVRGQAEVLFDANTPEEVVRWLRGHNVRSDGIFRVPLDPTVDVGGFAS